MILNDTAISESTKNFGLGIDNIFENVATNLILLGNAR
jgi:hypothetical protein